MSSNIQISRLCERFHCHRGVEIKQHWNLIPDDIDILITHGPLLGSWMKRFTVSVLGVYRIAIMRI